MPERAEAWWGELRRLDRALVPAWAAWALLWRRVGVLGRSGKWLRERRETCAGAARP